MMGVFQIAMAVFAILSTAERAWADTLCFTKLDVEKKQAVVAIKFSVDTPPGLNPMSFEAAFTASRSHPEFSVMVSDPNFGSDLRTFNNFNQITLTNSKNGGVVTVAVGGKVYSIDRCYRVPGSFLDSKVLHSEMQFAGRAQGGPMLPLWECATIDFLNYPKILEKGDTCYRAVAKPDTVGILSKIECKVRSWWSPLTLKSFLTGRVFSAAELSRCYQAYGK